MSTSRLYFAAGVACLTAAFFGYSVGFIGGILVLPSFSRHFNFSDLTSAELASVQSTLVLGWIVGASFGVPLGIPACQRLGRRMCLNLSAALYVLGAVLQLLDLGASSTETALGVFEAGRFLNGLGVGVGTLVTPIYMSEVSLPSTRGLLMGGFQLVIQISALVGFWCSFATNALIPSSSDLQWQIPVLIQLIPGAVLLVGTFLIPETPRYHAEQGQWEKAEEAISWLRNVPKEDSLVQQEVEDIQATIEANARIQRLHPESFWTQIVKKGIRNRLGVGVGIMVAQNIVGLNALNYFSPVIFMSAGFTSVSSSLLLTGIFGLVKLIAALLFMFYCIKTKSNRFWLQLGSSGCAISMLVLAYCVRNFASPEETDEGAGITAGGIIAVLMVYTFTFAFQISLGPISWVICGDIFPLHVNTVCCAITTCTQWVFQAIISASTPFMLAWSGWLTYLIYGCCCVATLTWITLFVPETRNVPLGRPMNKLFGMPEENDNEAGINESSALLRNEHMRRSSLASLNN